MPWAATKRGQKKERREREDIEEKDGAVNAEANTALNDGEVQSRR